MSFSIFIVALSFIGLASIFISVGLWRQESGWSSAWLRSRQGLGVLCFLAGGVGLVGGGQYKFSLWTRVNMSIVPELTPRFVGIVVIAFVLLGTGVVLRRLGAPEERGHAVERSSLFAWSMAAALILALAELNAIQTLDRLDRTVRDVPHVELDRRAVRAEQPFSRDYDFDEDQDWVSDVIDTWHIALEPYKGKADVRYLEIGIYQGRSFLWMAENILTHPTARLTGVDPFLDPSYRVAGDRSYRDVFYSNLKRSGIQPKVEVIEGFSQIELRKLPLNYFDFIYIDGSHGRADVLEDGILSWRLLKDDGVLIFDDYRLSRGMKRAVDTFVAFFADDFEPVHVGRQVILKKKAVDQSDTVGGG